MKLSSQEMEFLRQYRGATLEGKRKVKRFLTDTALRSRGQSITSHHADYMNSAQGVIKA
jgi:hypothetical protein